MDKFLLAAISALILCMIGGQLDPPDLNYHKEYRNAVENGDIGEMVRIGSLWYSNCKQIEEPDVVLTVAGSFYQFGLKTQYTYEILDRTIKRFRAEPEKYNALLCVGNDLEEDRLYTLLDLLTLKLNVATRLPDHTKYLESLRQIEAAEYQLTIG